ncbi:argininosuccinate synthase [Chthonomonas calidirosea]|uniref:Argininosuccinate synthase n=1 Tax=Chthonomonas calidirosea (strain DSM 23976 / ICMP 18418 / T49) TaxID=1303518 RepID=S0EVY0_CHTCT|nr:argininosuccinate synthase [Chthonomonas calidirosea]CCW35972.1 argininosuccinate synthase [Chthonomonas calidirosea T49]CEK17671.1 argininosuccinate synthase [Chthonomonas calidirosea]CEK17672.1 argininosuccinate synthase [Chthonomonas calidirosea]CEK18705.1 argininosuccinate synthase [Chthonomonas calidirosea]
MKKIVLVYSGGLDTSVCIPLVREEYGFDHVITVTVDVGQPEEDIRQAEERARRLGAEHYTIDAKQLFVEYFCWPAVRANGDYEGYPLSTSIARPLIALKAVEKARELGATAFGHGCTGKGNDQFRIEYILRTLMPEAEIIAPMREGRRLPDGRREPWTRSEEIDYANAHGLDIPQTKERIWSVDENLWGRSIEGGRLEEPDYAPPEEIFKWTRGPGNCLPTPQTITIEFEQGVPVALDGQRLDPVSLVTTLNRIAGQHGVGRIDIMEDRMLGLKVRENYECPAAVTLLTAHRALEALVCTQGELKFKAMVDREWGELAYKGLWFDPLKEDLEAFIARVQERVNGVVHLRLFQGTASVIGRNSPNALYSADLASFDSKTFDQSESLGIVKTHGLQSRMYFHLRQSGRLTGQPVPPALLGASVPKPTTQETPS